MDDKQLREAIEAWIDRIAPNKAWEQWRNIGVTKKGHLRPKLGSHYDEKQEYVDQLLALFHTYGNRERVDELEHIDNKPNVRLWFDGFYGVDDRIKELNREVES